MSLDDHEVEPSQQSTVPLRVQQLPIPVQANHWHHRLEKSQDRLTGLQSTAN